MRLLDSLYRIVSERQIDCGFEYTIQLNPEHFIYKAHFPGEPVTPGVCIMQSALELLERASGTVLSLKCAGNVKFLRIISPVGNTILTFTIKGIVREESQLKAQIIVASGNDVFSKLSLVCRTGASV